jgi:hypothetical protein
MQKSAKGGGSVSPAQGMDCSEKPEKEDWVQDDVYHEIVGEKRGNGKVCEWNCLYDKAMKKTISCEKVEFDYFMRQIGTRFARPFPKITR